MKKKGIIIALIILAIGFATVSTSLIINGTVGVGADVDDYDIIFTSAKIGNTNQTIKKTNKDADTIEFETLLNTLSAEKVLEYTVKNNSTQYEANARMKCYAVNDTDEYMSKYITISGELAGKDVTFTQLETNAVLSEEINFKAQESKNGTITMSLKRSYAETDEVSVTLKCEIITNALESDEVVDRVIPVVYPTAGLYDVNDNLLCEWDTCGIDVSSGVSTTDSTHIKNVIANTYPTAVKVVVSENVTTIASAAFARSTTLTTVILPETITSMGYSLFGGCPNITSVTIPGGVTSISSGQLAGTPNLKEVILSEGITTINASAFSGFANLEYVKLPDSLITIGNNAFYNTPKLNNIVLPKNLKSIGEFAFSATGLTSINIPGSVETLGKEIFSYSEKLTNVTIENGITSLSYRMFFYTGLTSITLPSSVTSIGDNAFYQCYKLEEVEIEGNLIQIGANAFYSCNKLENINLPESLETIAAWAFYNCTSLSNLVVPTNVTSIGNYAFNLVPHVTYYGTLTDSVSWGAKSIN